MTQAQLFIRSARLQSGLSQRALAERAEVQQPMISWIETGKHDATTETLDRLLRPLGRVVTLIPATTPSVLEVSKALGESVSKGEARLALRILIGLADGLASQDPATRIALAVAEPLPLGDAGWDAALAGLVEYRLRGLPVPGWISGQRFYSPEPFFVDKTKKSREWAAEHSAEEFTSRNVYIAESEFASL